jgi:hypothetical protein
VEASSSTFEKAHRLREFFLHVCRCAIENRPGEASEQQIGIRVFGRTPGYNANGDNIVRSQARLLRLKLEHHFANEGKDEPLIVSIPKGQYLPVFESRPQNLSDFHLEPSTFVAPARPLIGRRNSVWLYGFALTVVVLGATIWLRSTWLKSHPSPALVLSSARKDAAAPAGPPGQTAAPQVPALTPERRDPYRRRTRERCFRGRLGPSLGIRPVLQRRRFAPRTEGSGSFGA